MRWTVLVLVLVMMLTASAAAPRLYAQALDPTDNFDDGVIDPLKWFSYATPEASVAETGGKLAITTPASGASVEAELTSRWKLRGAFDVQVDYELLSWPTDTYAGLALILGLPGDNCSVQRASVDWNDPHQLYLAHYLWAQGGEVAGLTPTTDTAGTLRLVRDAEGILTAMYRSAGTADWVTIYTAPTPAIDTRILLAAWGDGTTPLSITFDNLVVNSGEVISLLPTIEDVQIDRGRDTDWSDQARYHQRVTVRVKGNGDEQPACIVIADPDGSQFVIADCNPGGWYDFTGPDIGGNDLTDFTEGPDYTYTYTWSNNRKRLPPQAGVYQITAICNGGTHPAVTTSLLPAVPEDGPTLTSPPADGVIETTVPTFEWLGWSDTSRWLQLRAEGSTRWTGPVADDLGEIWKASVDGRLSAVYNFYGSPEGPALDPGRSYFWQVNSWTPIDDRVTDPRVSIWTEQTARHRFTIDTQWPALPELPGKLVFDTNPYGDTSRDFDIGALVQYGTTPATRQWIGLDGAETPEFSWDGSKLLYRVVDTGLWIDSLDGTPPVQVPNEEAWHSSSFSPDATHVTYCQPESVDSDFSIWTRNVDGSDGRVLVSSSVGRVRRPQWSSDGLWVSHQRCCDPSGYNIWLTRYDGTESRPVLPTGVVGLSGYTVTWMRDRAVWSPDGKRVTTSFSAVSPDGLDVYEGIGTISRDGGLITPVFRTPPGIACCAAPRLEAWSPDGRSLVFSSGHHLTPDPEWANGKLEPGVEMWLVSADGTGTPTRLTYDYSLSEYATWWAPNTPAGHDIAITKGDATVTFQRVLAEGSTSVCVTPTLPAPLPALFTQVGDGWQILTTADRRLTTGVSLHYEESLVPAGEENKLHLLGWNGRRWLDITTGRGLMNNVITGRGLTLTRFVLARLNLP